MLKKQSRKADRHSLYREEYERAIARLKGKQMMTKRKSIVEPVFGILTQFMGMRKVFTKDIKQANKVMLMSAVAYNIKKYLKFVQKDVESRAKAGQEIIILKIN